MNGGATKGPESYCKITVFLKHHAPILYENIQDLCLFGAFNTRGRNGVTLLLPDNKSQAAINTLVGTDAKEAIAKIHACILPVYVANIAEFRVGSDIPNKLGLKLPIEKNNDKEVTLGNGTKITKNIKFKRLHADSNIAVYSINGLIPTEGESSSSMGKKKGGYGYSGGNDNLKRREDNDYSSEKTWESDFKEAHALTKLRIGTKGVDHLTYLGISLINHLLKSDDKSLKDLGELLCKVHAVSPLYYLFCGCLLTDAERKDWLANTHSYNKRGVLESHLAKGMYEKRAAVDRGHRDWSKFQIELNTTNVVERIKDAVNKISEEFFAGNAGMMDVIEYRFNSLKNFSNWILAMSEFTFLFTKHYQNAIKSGDNYNALKEIDHIFGCYSLWVLNACGSGDWSNALTLLNSEDMLPSKELFCTRISLFFSHRLYPMGGDFKTLCETENGNKGDVLYSLDPAPNTIMPTSDEHATAKFWQTTVANE